MKEEKLEPSDEENTEIRFHIRSIDVRIQKTVLLKSINTIILMLGAVITALAGIADFSQLIKLIFWRQLMDYLTIVGVSIGSLLILSYVILCYRKGKSPQFIDAALLLLAGSGAIAGVKVIVFAFNTELNNLVKKEGIDIMHVFVGGLAIFRSAILSVFEVFKNFSISTSYTTPT